MEQMSTWKQFCIDELKIACLFDKDSDYSGGIGKAVMELVEVFDRQDHSGASATFVANLFYRLANWKPLTRITSNPDEWICIRVNERGEKVFQSKRCPSVFTDEKLLAENKAYDIDYYYKIDENGATYTDKECTKIVDLPYRPKVMSELHPSCKNLITEKE